MDQFDLKQLTSRPEVQQVLNSPLAQKSLAVVLGLALLRYSNRTLNKWTVNNWQSDSWQGAKELVLVTGGTGGIGRQIMEDLSSGGARVVIVDIKEPDFKLRMFIFTREIMGEVLMEQQKTSPSTPATSPTQTASRPSQTRSAQTMATQRCW